MFSALKYQGQPLYKYARQGITIERQARPITIFQFELLQRQGDFADFIVHCSKGTYIRTLIDDLGELLGCGGHVSKLHRNQVGPFTAAQMVKPAQLDAMEVQCHTSADFSPLDALLLPLDAGIVTMPAIELNAEQQQQLQYGQDCTVKHDDIAAIKLLGPSELFIGVGQIQQGVLSSRRLLNTSAVQHPITAINAL
jgi:tRNA pseudouridine55 synthase